MAVTCEIVWRESSEYVDGGVDPELRREIDDHLKGCQRCTAVVEGLRNVVKLYGDERMAQLPAGFSERLQHKIEASRTEEEQEVRVFKPASRRGFLGWAAALAASVLLGGVVGISRYEARHGSSGTSSQVEHEKKPIPADLPVLVAAVASDNPAKLFHVAGCPRLVNPQTARHTTAGEAMRAGLMPCPHCLAEYV